MKLGKTEMSATRVTHLPLPLRHVEPVSCDFEPSLWRHNTDIENWRPETGVRNWSDVAQNSENSASETRQRLANSRECRASSCASRVVQRDPTPGWRASIFIHFELRFRLQRLRQYGVMS